MKKIFAIILSMFLTVAWWGGYAAEKNKQEHQCGDFRYNILEDGTAEITEYTGNISNLNIPDKLDGYAVQRIGDRAFYECTSLESVIIPDSVTSIGDSAFYFCKGLTSVTIGMAVEYVGPNPFILCEELTKIAVSPDHPFLTTINNVLVHKLDKRLICYPPSLSAGSYVVPNGILSIGDRAFLFCTSLESVIIPDSVTSIGDSAFSSCKGLTSVIIPDSVTSIGTAAFLKSNNNLTLTVGRNSYAKEYATENDILYTYTDANDWLNN